VRRRRNWRHVEAANDPPDGLKTGIIQFSDRFPSMSKLDKMLKAARRAKERIDAMLLPANVQDSGEARVSATFLLTIAEQFAAMVHLVEGKFSTHAPILVRSMLDELVDLRNLVDDPNYLDQLKFEDARSNVLMVDDFAADPDISSDPSTRMQLAEWRQKYQPIYDTLKSQGLKPQRATQKFLRAKVSSLYVPLGLSLCVRGPYS
jgi:hypothetical protein